MGAALVMVAGAALVVEVVLLKVVSFPSHLRDTLSSIT